MDKKIQIHINKICSDYIGKKLSENAFISKLGDFMTNYKKERESIKDDALKSQLDDLKNYKTSYSYVKRVENNIDKIIKTDDVSNVLNGAGNPKIISSNNK